jgi:hypothetical protein
LFGSFGDDYMTEKTPLPRVAFSPGEFAALFGKGQTWGYRQIYAGKVKTITEYGRIQIPATEVERILGTAGTYNGLKPKVAKKNAKLDGWRRFLEERRNRKRGSARPSSRPPGTAKGNSRNAALARLTRGGKQSSAR